MNPANPINRRDFVAAGQVQSGILAFDDPVEEFGEHLRIERSQFDDKSIRLLPVEFAGVYFLSVPPVARDGRAEGPHVRDVGRPQGQRAVRASGRLHSPPDGEFPELLKPRWEMFERPIPFPL